MLEELCKMAHITRVCLVGRTEGFRENVTVECCVDADYRAHPEQEEVDYDSFAVFGNLAVRTDARHFESTMRILQDKYGFRAFHIALHIGALCISANFASDSVVVKIDGSAEYVDDSVEGENCKPFKRKLYAGLDNLGKTVYEARWLIESRAFANLIANIRSTGGVVLQE